MTDPRLDDLKRRAYSGDGEDARAAQIELAQLAPPVQREQDGIEPPTLSPSLPFTSSRRLRGWVAALACGALIAATATVTAPRSSLLVFDRAATGIDAEMQTRVPPGSVRAFPRPLGLPLIDAYWDVIPVAGSARWLGESQGYDVFGYLGEGVEPVEGPVVCLGITQAPALLVVWCVPEDEFARTGIQEYRQSRPVDKIVHLTVLWGPTGDARIYDRPLDEVTQR